MDLSLKNLCGGVAGVDLFDDALENPVLVEDKCAAKRPKNGFAVHFLFSALFQSADQNRPYSIVRG